MFLGQSVHSLPKESLLGAVFEALLWAEWFQACWLDLHQKLGRLVSACVATFGKTLKSILVFIKLVFGDINWGVETHQMLSLWVQSPVGFLCSCVSVSWILYLVFYFGGWRCGNTNLVSGPDCEWRLSVKAKSSKTRDVTLEDEFMVNNTTARDCWAGWLSHSSPDALASGLDAVISTTENY